jgi:UDP-2,3-diacylglucosamine pyrophosphatase LpxH
VTELVVIQPDTHIPDHHGRAAQAFFGWLADIQPARVVQIGDLFDFLSVARWSTGTPDEDGRKMQREVDAGRRYFTDLRSAYQGPFGWMQGNHEARMGNYLRTKGQGLLGLNALSVPNLMGMADFDIEVLRQPHQVAPGVEAIHGIKLGARAGMSVDKELTRRKRSLVQGHCHRQAIVYRQVEGERRFGVEAGHMMDQRRADYLEHGLADWQLGFAVLYVDGRDVQPVLVSMREDGSFLWEGRRFRA